MKLLLFQLGISIMGITYVFFLLENFYCSYEEMRVLIILIG